MQIYDALVRPSVRLRPYTGPLTICMQMEKTHNIRQLYPIAAGRRRNSIGHHQPPNIHTIYNYMFCIDSPSPIGSIANRDCV